MEAALAAVDDGFATDSDDIAKLIQWGLAQLPRDEAGILEQFHFDERSMASIAKDLHLSDRAVEGRLRRARVKLRRVIDRTLTRQGAQR
jgi:DNA-directed RNA polymerase specialized sigma24 family protein